MNNCPHCEKTYKTIGKLNNHILINHNDKVILPSQKEMWFIIKDLIKKNEQQEKRIQKLERVINKDIKNVNILDWLNKNDKGIEIDIWLKTSVNVTLDDLYMIGYSGYNFTGSSITFHGSKTIDCLVSYGWNDRINSLKIIQK